MFYVYELQDDIGKTFYVGKGHGERMNSHLKSALHGSNKPVHKKIRELLAAGKSFCAKVVYETQNEEDAYGEEKRLIASYGLANLTNVDPGGRGIRFANPKFVEEWRKVVERNSFV